MRPAGDQTLRWCTLTHAGLGGAGQRGGRGQQRQRQRQRVAHAQDGVRVSSLSFVLQLLLRRRGATEAAAAGDTRERKVNRRNVIAAEESLVYGSEQRLGKYALKITFIL